MSQKRNANKLCNQSKNEPTVVTLTFKVFKGQNLNPNVYTPLGIGWELVSFWGQRVWKIITNKENYDFLFKRRQTQFSYQYQ